MKKHRRRRFQRKLKYKYMAACIGISLFLVLILTGSYYGYFNKLFVTQTQDYVFNMAEQSKDSLEPVSYTHLMGKRMCGMDP